MYSELTKQELLVLAKNGDIFAISHLIILGENYEGYFEKFKNSDNKNDQAHYFYILYKKGDTSYLDKLKELANEDVANACFYLFLILDDENESDQANEEEFSYIKRCIKHERSNSTFCAFYGFCATAYKNGNEVNGEKYLLDAASDGNILGQLFLGEYYLESQINVEAAAKWLMPAANRGISYACYLLGIYYKDYSISDNHYEKAIYYLNKSYEISSQLYAIYDICDIYEVLNDYEKSFNLYLEHANKGDGYSLLQVGLYYDAGNYVEQNKEIALEYFKKAYEKGEYIGAANIGYYYDAEYDGDDGDELAIKWYEKAIELKPDYAVAINNIGEIYKRHKEYEKAIEYFKRTADLGDPDGMFDIALFYERGYLEEVDHEKAREWYEKAAKLGHSTACNNLGYYYEHNYDGQDGRELAIYWYKKAIELDSDNTVYLTNLAFLYDDLENYEEAFNLFKAAADKNSKDAQYKVGQYYKEGLFVKEDINEAIKWYKLSSDNGCYDATKAVASYYQSEQYNGKDGYELSLEWYLKSLDQTDNKAEAYYNIGASYRDLEDFENSFKYFKMSADLGYAKGQFSVGYYYDSGIYVEQNPKEAMKWYELAANQKHPVACNNLGYIYENSDEENHLEKAIYWYKKAIEYNPKDEVYYTNLAQLYFDNGDYEKSYEYYMKAADLGDPSGMFNIGYFYDNGFYVKKDYKEAAIWYEKAAKLDHAIACNNLAFYYDNYEESEDHIEKAIYWYKRSIELDPNGETSINNLAILYDDLQDYETAYKYFEMTANLNSSVGQFYLGLYYDRGLYVKQDFEEAKKWYELAANQGHATACNNLGYIYYYHENNADLAINWYKKSIELDKNNAVSCNNIGFVLSDKNDYETAFKYFMLSAEQDNPVGQFNVGLYYDRGYYVEKNYPNAIKWYELAAKQNHALACNNLGFVYENHYDGKDKFEKARMWYEKAIELDDNSEQAYRNLAYLYFNHREQNKLFLKLAKDMAIKANEIHPEYANELLEEIEKALQELAGTYVDINNFTNFFVSWNHNAEKIKNKIVDTVINNGFSIWRSNTDCTGEIKKACQEGVNGCESIIFLMTDDYFQSEWMKQELDWAYERFSLAKRDDLVIPIWIGQKVNEVRNNPDSQSDAFKWLATLGGLFSVEEIDTSLPKRLIDAISLKRLYDYQNKIRNDAALFEVFISNYVKDNNDRAIITTFRMEDKFYINRVLKDDMGNDYQEKDVLNLKCPALIIGNGGIGKSLYLQKLICSNINKYYFFDFKISDLSIYFSSNPDKSFADFLLDRINTVTGYTELLAKSNKSLSALENDGREKYLLIDALDEFNTHSNLSLTSILLKIEAFMTRFKNFHIILTARSDLYIDDLVRAKINNTKVLVMNHLTDDEAKSFVRNFYDSFYTKSNINQPNQNKSLLGNVPLINPGENSISEFANIYSSGDFANNIPFESIGFEQSNSALVKITDNNKEKKVRDNSKNSGSLLDIKTDDVVEALDDLDDDIKYNPLLLTNFTILVMKEKKIVKSEVEIVERSSGLLFKDVEKSNNVFKNDKYGDELVKLVNRLDYFLEYIAYVRSIGGSASVTQIIKSAIGKLPQFKDYEEKDELAIAFYQFLHKRAIIVGGDDYGNVYHEIFRTFFASKYIYRQSYDNDVIEGICFANEGDTKLCHNIERIINIERRALIIPLLFTYIDYQANNISHDLYKNESYYTIEKTYNLIFKDGNNNESKNIMMGIINKGSLYKTQWFKEIFKM